uniref:Uncharacterized protein LOC101495357 n=1 Tax=Cicer arietinum TaxID=3827 RepID=A0A1S2YHN6_CICAR|nr:uncharacterized protein LOC101495357 [Cicer arietinum]
MAGLLRNVLGLNYGGNNGTVDAFNNKLGTQDYDEAEFNTGAEIKKGSYPTHSNNGTKKAFNNSWGGTQKFGKAKFNTGAKIGN